MNNIILIGMMGSGKTTIAKQLTEYFSYNVIDTDFEIEKKENLTIDNIFNLYGEKYFRQLEEDMLLSLKNINNSIIATGGGLILNDNTYELRRLGIVIYLRASEETLVNRLSKKTENRPLLSIENLKNKITKILSDRKNIYENIANVIIDVDKKNIDEICMEIFKNI